MAKADSIKMFKAQNILPADQIAFECQRIQNYCEAEYNADVPAAVVDRAGALEGYMAITGKMLADAKWHYSDVLNSVFMDAVKQGQQGKLQTSTLNKYIESLCKDYAYLVDWTERLNRTCTHCLELSRSLISKHKAEYQANQYSGSR